MMNPPRNRKMTLLKYKEAVFFPLMMPRNGNRTTGIKAVAGSGIASVTHNSAIRMATAIVLVTSGCLGLRSTNRRKKRKRAIPVTRESI